MQATTWQPHFWKLLHRSWEFLVAWMGTTTPGIVVSVAVLIFVLAVSTYSNLSSKYARYSVVALWDAAKDSVRPVLVTAVVTTLAWIILFAIFVGKAVYQDHMGLVSAKTVLKEENNKIAKDRDDWKAKAGNKRTPDLHGMPTDRHLADWQKKAMGNVLQSVPVQPIGIVTILDHPERNAYAKELERVFLDNGWSPQRYCIDRLPAPYEPNGVVILKRSDDQLMPDIRPLQRALESVRIPHPILAIDPHRYPTNGVLCDPPHSNLFMVVKDTVPLIMFVGPRIETP
jgi:hypothetical protein